jgi:hypothetical protein
LPSSVARDALVIQVRQILYGIACVAVLSAGAACGSSEDKRAELHSPVRGVLQSVDVWPDGGIKSIILATDDGNEVEFSVELTDTASVDAAHLQLHVDQRWPVSVTFGGSDQGRVAYAIDDAPD